MFLQEINVHSVVKLLLNFAKKFIVVTEKKDEIEMARLILPYFYYLLWPS